MHESTLCLLQCVFYLTFLILRLAKKVGTHREGSWTRSLRLMPLRSSARFRKQLSLTGTTNGSRINTQRLRKIWLSHSAPRIVTSFTSGWKLIAPADASLSLLTCFRFLFAKISESARSQLCALRPIKRAEPGNGIKTPGCPGFTGVWWCRCVSQAARTKLWRMRHSAWILTLPDDNQGWCFCHWGEAVAPWQVTGHCGRRQGERQWSKW